MQCTLNGHPLNTFEKQAPIWTFGVGGSPFEMGRGGVCRRRWERFGGTGGVLLSRSGGWASFSTTNKIIFLDFQLFRIERLE